MDKRSPVDQEHYCDTSGSFRALIGQHSKATSSEHGSNPSVVHETLYRMDMLQYTNVQK